MPKKVSILILDLGLILLAFSAVIYWKLDEGAYISPFWNYDLLKWMPYVGLFLAASGFIFYIKDRNRNKSSTP